MKKRYGVLSCILLLVILLLGSYQVTADDPPLFQEQGQHQTTIGIGERNTLYAQGRDDGALDWAWLSTDETGEWQDIKPWWDSDWSYSKQIIINIICFIVSPP